MALCGRPMTEKETIQLIALVKGLYQEQATDPITAKAWYELMRGLEYQDAKQGVKDLAEQGSPRPSAAMVYRAARTAAGRRLQAHRGRFLGLPAPDLSPEERAANRAKLRAILDEIKLKTVDK